MLKENQGCQRQSSGLKERSIFPNFHKLRWTLSQSGFARDKRITNAKAIPEFGP
jgi:hypothetical protein